MTTRSGANFLATKIDKLINFLHALPVVQQNPEAMSKLPSFRDVKWTIWYIQSIQHEYRKNSELILSQMITECGMKDLDFKTEERAQFNGYLNCFVSFVEKYCPAPLPETEAKQ